MNCNKKPFDSMEEANLRAGEINSENKSNRMRPYRCSCGKIHLTSKSKEEYKKRSLEKRKFLRIEADYWETKFK